MTVRSVTSISPFLLILPAIYYTSAELTLQSINGHLSSIEARPDGLRRMVELLSGRLVSIETHQNSLGQRIEFAIIMIEDHHDAFERKFESLNDRLSVIEARLELLMYTTAATFTIFSTSQLMSWILSMKFGRFSARHRHDDPASSCSDQQLHTHSRERMHERGVRSDRNALGETPGMGGATNGGE